MSVIGFPGYPIAYMKYMMPVFHIRADDTVTVATARCYLAPIEVRVRVTVDRIVVGWRTPAVGNVRAAIYKDNGDTPEGGALVVESASVAKVGTWQKQEIVIASTVLEPGLYWLSIQSDENTSVVDSEVDGIAQGGTLNAKYYDRGGGYGAFTNPCPAVTLTSDCPIIFLRVASVYQPLT